MKIATVSLDYYSMNSAAACKKAAAAARRKKFDFAGFTEVRSEVMKDGLKAGIRPGNTLALVFGGESPQAFNNTKWKLIDVDIRDGNDGVAGITPTLKFVIGVYQNVEHPHRVIEVVSTHFVPLTQGGKPRSQYARRWAMWSMMWKKLHKIVDDAHEKGRTIFVIGDFNHIKAKRSIIKRLNPKAKWIVRSGLDWVFVVEGNVKVYKVGSAMPFYSGSDHKARIRRVILR